MKCITYFSLLFLMGLQIVEAQQIANSSVTGVADETYNTGISSALHDKNGQELVSLFHNQLAVFPQEKIYLHTDKPYYLSGERIWFRAHLANAATHIPEPVSRYVYV